MSLVSPLLRSLPFLGLACHALACGPDKAGSETVSPDAAAAPAVVGAGEGQAANDEFPAYGNGCQRGDAEGGELVLFHRQEGYTVVIGDAGWEVNCTPEHENLIFQAKFQSVTLQLAKIPSTEFESVAKALEAFAMGGRTAMQQQMSLPADVAFEHKELGEDKVPGLCWGGPVVSGGDKLQHFACASAKAVPDSDTIVVSHSSMFAVPEEWQADEVTLRSAGETLAASFFLDHELLDEE